MKGVNSSGIPITLSTSGMAPDSERFLTTLVMQHGKLSAFARIDRAVGRLILNGHFHRRNALFEPADEVRSLLTRELAQFANNLDDGGFRGLSVNLSVALARTHADTAEFELQRCVIV
jgi:hypothetical protein